MYGIMAPLQDGHSLQEAIRTTLLQLCKVGVAYQSELAIKGTLGVTVDRRQVILVHFDEKVESNYSQVDSSQMFDGPVAKTPISDYWPTQMVDHLHQDINAADNRLTPGGFAFNTRAESTSKVTRSFLPDSPSKPFNIIDLDSDSESFGALNFEDDDQGGNLDEPRDFKTDLSTAGEPYADLDSKNITDIKNIVVIGESSDNSNEKDDAETNGVGDLSTSSLLGSTGEYGKEESTYLVKSCTSTKNDSKLHSESSPHYEQDMELRFEDGLVLGKAELSQKGGKASRMFLSKLKYSCDVCGKMLPSVRTLEMHLVDTHDVTETTEFGKIPHFKCERCPKKFKYQATLDKHLFMHIADKPYKCYLCSNKFIFQESLNIHMNAHSDNFHCNICQKGYSSKQLFQKHIVYKHEMRRVAKR